MGVVILRTLRHMKNVAICILDLRDFSFRNCCFAHTLRVGKAKLFWAKKVLFGENKKINKIKAER